MKKNLSFWMLSILLLVISSCSTPTDVVYLQDLTPDSPKTEPAIQYIKVKKEDKLRINVHCRDENIANLFNVRGHGYYSSGGYGMGGSSLDLYSYNVDENGDIDFPVVGKIHVEGLTRQQVADQVRKILVEQNLVKDPYVSCSFASSYFYTMGEIKGTGQIQIPRDAFTILEAIAQCGDVNLQGVRTNIRVIREVDGQLRSYLVDLTSAESLVKSPVYYIQPNDIIYVEPTKKQQYATTALGNTVRTPTFWLGLVGTTISVGLSIYSVIRRF